MLILQEFKIKFYEEGDICPLCGIGTLSAKWYGTVKYWVCSRKIKCGFEAQD